MIVSSIKAPSWGLELTSGSINGEKGSIEKGQGIKTTSDQPLEVVVESLQRVAAIKITNCEERSCESSIKGNKANGVGRQVD